MSQFKKTSSWLFTASFIILIGLAVLLCTLSVYLWISPYETIITQLINSLHLHAKASVIRDSYFTASRFMALKYVVILSSIGYSLSLVLLYRFRSKTQLLLLQLIHETWQWGQGQCLIWKGFPQKEQRQFLVFFLGLTTVKIALALSYPFHIDEAFSYVFLVSKGTFVTASFYPGPNNHIAYLLICSALDHIISSPVLVMRLPSIFFSSFTIPLLYFSLRPYFSKTLIFSYLLFVFCSEFGLFYAVHGRGYAMQSFLIILVFLAAIKWYQSGNRSSQLALILFSSLGFYTLPSFVYFFAALMVIGFIFLRNTAKLKRAFLLITLIGLVVLLLYSPILLLSGWRSILANSWVQALSFPEFIQRYPSYLWQMQGNLIGFENFGGIITLLVWAYGIYLLVSTASNKSFAAKTILKPSSFQIKKFTSILLTISIFPLIMLIFQRVLPFDRVWQYKSLAELLLLAIFLMQCLHYFKPIGRKTIWGCLMAFYLFSAGNATYHYINNPASVYQQVPKLISKIVDQKVKHALVTEDVYNVFLRLHAQQTGKGISVSVKPSEVKYDLLILRKADIFPLSLSQHQYQLFYEDDFVRAYRVSQ